MQPLRWRAWVPGTRIPITPWWVTCRTTPTAMEKTPSRKVGRRWHLQAGVQVPFPVSCIYSMFHFFIVIWLLFAQDILFHSSTFNLFMSLDKKLIYYRQLMFEICFLIHSANLFLLIRKFKWFTFRVTTDKKGLTPAILLFFLYVLYLFFPLFPSLLSFLFNWFIVVYLLDFLISFTVYFYTFLVVIIGITINILSL